MFSQEVSEILDLLKSGVQSALSENLLGLYLRGSLAFGEFIPETSDIDILAVTARPVTAGEYRELERMHAVITGLRNPYANRIEIAYIHWEALKRFHPGERHPTLGQGETLEWSEHSDNWILERWTVREHGLTLLGPDPRALIDPISSGEIVQAVRSRLGDWAGWANDPDDLDWLLPRSHKAYVIETMCRALYTLANGELCSKARAVIWALEVLPEPWRTLVDRSRDWRLDQTVDPSINADVRQFVLWASAEPYKLIKTERS